MSYKLDKIFCENVVLPADVPVRIWGEADCPVTVSVDYHSGVCFAFDGKFSLTACRCIGTCGLAPVLTVNEDVYGKLTKDQIAGILAKYKA